jgi:hypothetical protein
MASSSRRSSSAEPSPALSTGYYALFHLLIEDAIEPCSDAHLKYSLSRLFDHGPMKQACERTTSELNRFFEQNPPDGPEKTFNDRLATVAEAFSQAQHSRNDADYNRSEEWDVEQAGRLLDVIAEAFQRVTIYMTDQLC